MLVVILTFYWLFYNGDRVQMKKEKGVALGSSPSSRSYDEYEYKEEEKLNIPAVRFSTRNASSKYDFVKVPFS